MSETVDIWRVLRIAMATAVLAVVLIVPTQSQAANDCAAAGTDPTAAQYCPPTPPQPIEEEQERCTENGQQLGLHHQFRELERMRRGSHPGGGIRIAHPSLRE